MVPEGRRAKLPDVGKSEFSTTEAPNSYEDITTYNNFYEFGTGKRDPKKNAHTLRTEPWSVVIDGSRPAGIHRSLALMRSMRSTAAGDARAMNRPPSPPKHFWGAK